MRVWKQLLIGLGVISAGVLLWGRFAPGANGVLTAAGLPASLVAAIAPASDEKADDGNQGSGRRGGFGGGPTLVATKPVAMATVTRFRSCGIAPVCPRASSAATSAN